MGNYKISLNGSVAAVPTIYHNTVKGSHFNSHTRSFFDTKEEILKILKNYKELNLMQSLTESDLKDDTTIYYALNRKLREISELEKSNSEVFKKTSFDLFSQLSEKINNECNLVQIINEFVEENPEIEIHLNDFNYLNISFTDKSKIVLKDKSSFLLSNVLHKMISEAGYKPEKNNVQL